MSPGVIVTTATRSAPAANQQAAAATYFAGGITERGPIDKAVRVTSLTEFEQNFGAWVSYGALHADIQTFFEEGGGAAYIGRVVGPSASKSSLTLVDRAGSPVSTLRIDAINPGSWGTGITVEVQNGSVTDTFTLIISYSGTGNLGTETYRNLTSPAAAVTALLNSSYVRGVNLASATSAPNNNPAVISATALSGGSDDRNNITSSVYATGLTLFSKDYGAGAVAIPGQPASAVGIALRNHAVANRRIALTAPAVGNSVAQTITDVATFTASIGTTGPEYMGFFYPWVKIPDSANPGATKTISPEGFVAAKRAIAHETYGPVRAPAGELGIADFVVDTEITLTTADSENLNAANVSPILPVKGTLRLYGWKSLSSDSANYELLGPRDLVNYIVVDLESASEQFVFETIDGLGRLFSNMQAVYTGRLDVLKTANQFFQKTINGTPDNGYRVDVDSVNTPATIAQNIAQAAVNVRPAGSAEYIKVMIAKVPIQGSV